MASFNRDTFVPFIGAGCSVPLGEPDWPQLFDKLKEKYGLNICVSEGDNCTDYPTAFSQVCERIGTKENFFSEVFALIEPKVTQATFFHVRLVDAFDCYVTTNYDTPIETAYLNQRGRPLRKQYFFCPQPGDDFRDCIIYLHGHKDIRFVVIVDEDYRYFYPTIGNAGGFPVLEDFIKYLFVTKSLVFIGFSFADAYVREYFRHLAKTVHSTKIRHFLLIDEDVKFYRDFVDRATQFEKLGRSDEARSEVDRFYGYVMKEFRIYPIVYRRGYHIFMERLFELLGGMGDTVEIKKTPISGAVP